MGGLVDHSGLLDHDLGHQKLRSRTEVTWKRNNPIIATKPTNHSVRIKTALGAAPDQQRDREKQDR